MSREARKLVEHALGISASMETYRLRAEQAEARITELEAALSKAARNPEQRCPVCSGNGIVPHGFYAAPVGYTVGATDTAPEQCRRCDGLGTIICDALRATKEVLVAGDP